MKSFVRRKFLDFAIFVFGTYLLECVSFAFMGWGFFPVYFFLDLIFLAVLGIVIFFVRNTLFDRIYLPIISFICAFLFYLNANYYVSTGSIFAISDFQFIGKLGTIIDTATKFIRADIMSTIFVLWGVFSFLIIFINIKFKRKIEDKIKKDKFIIVASAFSLLFSVVFYPIVLYSTSEYEKNINQNILIDQVNLAKNYNYQRLGMFAYYIKDIQCTFFGGIPVSYNDFKTYCLSEPTKTNEFTGLLKDYNVVTVMIETGARDMLNETLTPNLYELTKNGIDCKSSYQKNKTNVSEYTGILGNYTTNGIDMSTYNYAVPFSLPNILNTYQSVYAHDVGTISDTYSRHTAIKKYGFKKVFLHEELNPGQEQWDYYWFSLDSENTQSLIRVMKEQKIVSPYYLFYTTLTMHGPYVKYDRNEKYYKKLESLYLNKLKQAKSEGKWVNHLDGTPQGTQLDNYMLKCMDFDMGLKYLIDYLKESNQFDNTLLLLYGDHDVYYDADEKKTPLSFYIYGKNNLDEIDLYNTMYVLYNPKLNNKYYSLFKKHTYDDFCTSYSIVSTICDLLGVRYNDKLYLEESIFNKSKNQRVFYSYELSEYMNKNYLSKSGNKIEKIFSDNKTQKEFLASCNDYIRKLIYMNYIYSNNIFVNHNYEELLG